MLARAAPASYRRAKRCQCVSVNGAESSSGPPIVIQREDDFANPPTNIDTRRRSIRRSPRHVTVSRSERTPTICISTRNIHIVTRLNSFPILRRRVISPSATRHDRCRYPRRARLVRVISGLHRDLNIRKVHVP